MYHPKTAITIPYLKRNIPQWKRHVTFRSHSRTSVCDLIIAIMKTFFYYLFFCVCVEELWHKVFKENKWQLQPVLLSVLRNLLYARPLAKYQDTRECQVEILQWGAKKKTKAEQTLNIIVSSSGDAWSKPGNQLDFLPPDFYNGPCGGKCVVSFVLKMYISYSM